jgi:hypothetical protein
LKPTEEKKEAGKKPIYKKEAKKNNKRRQIRLSLFNKNNDDESNYNIGQSIEKSIEEEGETVQTNNRVDKQSSMELQDSLRSIRSARNRQLPIRYR